MVISGLFDIMIGDVSRLSILPTLLYTGIGTLKTVQAPMYAVRRVRILFFFFGFPQNKGFVQVDANKKKKKKMIGNNNINLQQ